MLNKDEPAHPVVVHNSGIHKYGLTKREYFAGLALQGFITADAEDNYSYTELSERSVKAADTLLQELDNAKS